MTGALDCIPGELRQRPQWVAWKYVAGKDGKQTKLPVNVLTGTLASSTDPQTWTTFENAIAKRNGNAGSGYVFSADDPYTGVDFDGCYRKDTGEIAPWAHPWITKLNSYSEVSPSGTGIKIWVKAKWPLQSGKQVKISESEFVSGKDQKIEIYDHARYFAVTGQRLSAFPSEIQERQSVIDELCKTYFSEKKHSGAAAASSFGTSVFERARKYIATIPGAISGQGGHNQTFHVACVLVLGFGLSKQEAFTLLSEYNCRCEPEWTERELQHKIDSADQQPGERGYLRFDNYSCQSAYDRNLSTIVENQPTVESQGLTLDDFHAYMPMHSYICAPTRDLWPASSVNVKVEAKDDKGEPVKASSWLDCNRTVEQMTWAPGDPMIIEDRLISEGGWIRHPGCKVFNLYRPPQRVPGDPAKATEWIGHIAKVYPDDCDHIIKWLAHRVQKPQEKINHALVLGGLQGIGKDTLLEPVKQAIGPWNFCEVSPVHLLGRFNGWIKSVILRVNEARDLGEVDRFAFYDHLKAYTAAPPDVLRCDEKNIREYSVFNVCGVVITTNHKTDGIYLPADDRRHYVAWSDLAKDDFKPDYWTKLYRWYTAGGSGHVAAYLHSIDLTTFDPKAPPPKTDALWSIADANRAPEDSELADALDALGNPVAVTLADIVGKSKGAFNEWLRDRKNSRQIPYRMEAAGYMPVRNQAAKDGLWKLEGKRQVIYALRELPVRDRIKAAMDLTKESSK